MAKRIETFVNFIVSQLDCSESEKAELADEIHTHLFLLKDEFRKKGFSEEQAVSAALFAFKEGQKRSNGIKHSTLPYVKFTKWGGFLFCWLLAFLFMKEGFSLLERMNHPDGEGVGVYFFLFEINDQVPLENVPLYITGFLAASVVAVIFPFVVFHRKVSRYIAIVWASA
ncbi:hypothetical protein QWY14_02130 [Planococcus sp. N028]|uniref:TPM domain-containing protein n=1 Tax=Planococcus shixiaomingii TaxID=3058393 RepID=A0ABT8MYA4_9BACL|nr:hypothetical protein [Planococcus sp. N028]MDN7240565.1 hypothetical protein [Planococcus sp. N028]